MKRCFFLVPLFFSITLFAQRQKKSGSTSSEDKVKITDTIRVSNYYILKPYILYNVYDRVLICEGNYYLSESLRSTLYQKYSYGTGLSCGKKIKKMHYGLSLLYIHTKEYYAIRVLYASNKDSILSTESILDQISVGATLGYEVKLKAIKIIPAISFFYSFHSTMISSILLQDQTLNYHKTEYPNLYKKNGLSGKVGVEVSFFNQYRISPFIGYAYFKWITKEAMTDLNKIKMYKHNNLISLGINIKL